MRSKRGFTLIEMLAVIAIVAVLVSVVIPTVSESTERAKAAADAANLRATYGAMNSIITLRGDPEDFAKSYNAPASQYVENCEMHILYAHPGFIEVYYVDGETYYSLEYLVAVSQRESTEQFSISKPSTVGIWYQVGVGKVN